MMVRCFARAGVSLPVLGLLVFSLGCGPDLKARATVKGKVSIGGKTLTTGNVTFHGANNMTGVATIDKNGNYEMKDAPLGDVKITIFVPKMPPGGISAMKGSQAIRGKDAKSVDPSGSGKSISIMGDMPTHVVPIPDKYGDVDSSGLTYTVTKGEQTKDINLTY